MSQEEKRSGERAPYFHLDLNAGEGYNADQRVVGTPLLFMRQVKKRPALPYRAVFTEKNRERHASLCKRLAPYAETGDLFGLERHHEARRVDNAGVLATLPESVSRVTDAKRARGSIISDPNGISPKVGAMDLEVAADVARALPQFVLLIFFPYVIAKRIRRYVELGERGPVKGCAVRTVQDHLHLRPHWLISEPAGPYVYLCGTPKPFPPGKEGVPAWPVSSKKGRDIVRFCDDYQGEEREVA